jgi:hypothetical protein
MSAVDVSGVLVQEYKEHDEEGEVVQGLEMMNFIKSDSNGGKMGILEACTFCRAYGGYVVRCNYNCPSSLSPSSSSAHSQSSCSAAFHPLCAWFQGVRVETTITDPSFQGKDTGGKYPSCLSFCFLCKDHCPGDVRGSTRDAQKTLRMRYKINEDDLDQIPGRNRIKRKKKRPPPPAREVIQI